MPGSKLQLGDVLHEESILCELSDVDSGDVIKRLVASLADRLDGADAAEVLRAVLDREQIAPTVIAPGLALPHARLPGLKKLVMAVGLAPEGIRFGDEDEPVCVVILVLTPTADPSAYLRLVAAVSKALGEPEVRRKLSRCREPAPVMDFLVGGQNQLPEYICARDVMLSNPVKVAEGDTLASAIQKLFTHRVMNAPVVDEEGDLRGVIAVEDLLRLSLPEHLLWMEDLTPIVNFQPFAELLRKDQETRIADFMREEYLSVQPDTPAVQLAKLFLLHNGVRQIYVLEGRRLKGVVNLETFVSQLFWA